MHPIHGNHPIARNELGVDEFNPRTPAVGALPRRISDWKGSCDTGRLDADAYVYLLRCGDVYGFVAAAAGVESDSVAIGRKLFQGWFHRSRVDSARQDLG